MRLDAALDHLHDALVQPDSSYLPPPSYENQDDTDRDKHKVSNKHEHMSSILPTTIRLSYLPRGLSGPARLWHECEDVGTDTHQGACEDEDGRGE